MQVKPCPFCGVELEYINFFKVATLEWKHPDNYCFLANWSFEDRPYIVKRWNHRGKEDD